MPLDDLVLGLQRFVDRLIRRARRGCAPTAGRRRLLVVQIDGLSRGVLELALTQGRMPFLRRVMERGGWRLHPMFVGLPSSTPAFQMAAMYGVRPDIPGFHYHEKRRREDVYFPRDIYAGAPAIYVNYLDYDVLSHAYGPRHGRALRSLRRVDAAIKQIWRVCRRVPEHGYDLYVLSDHGQALCTPFAQVAGGRRFERVIFEDFFTPHGARAVGPERPAGRHHLASGIKALRMGRAPGFFQRFFNYIEEGFPWVLGEVKEARERDNVRVICAGPNAFIYFVDDAAPLAIDRIEKRWPGLAEDLSRHPGVGYVFARGADAPVCFWRGKRYRLTTGEPGPFAGRADAALVVSSIGDLMAMPSAGDFVIYGIDAAPGHVSYIAEAGAHAGPSPEELHAFVVAPPAARFPEPPNHPVQLYPHFVRYLEVPERESAA